MSSYVPGYEYDVFISYSHANDYDKWVSKFHQKLEARLKECVPPGATIFRDTEGMQGNDELTPTLVEHIRGSAVLVMIVSRSYIESAWCRKECSEFLAVNAQQGTKRRVFVVLYEDLSPAEYQQLAGERLGYKFFAPTGKFTDAVDPDNELFRTRMIELREEIGAKLKDLKAQAIPVPVVPRAQAARPAVFLAAPSPGLGELTDQLASWLRGFQYEVVRAGERFYEADQYESTFAAGLKRSVAFVQLLGRRFDPRDDDRVPSWDQWQFLQAQTAGIPTLRWFNKYDQEGKEIDVEKLDADHRAFVTQPDVWNCDAYRFRETVRTEIDKQFHDKQQRRVPGAEPLIVLRSDRSDKTFAESIGRNLEELNCEWIFVPDRDVTSLEEFAVQCAANGLLVIYRACPGTWVLARLQELRKFVKSDFGRRWACGLWRAPEDPDEALSCSVNGLCVCPPQDLQQFVAAVRERL